MGMIEKAVMDALGLTPEDWKGIKDGIQGLKKDAPQLVRRVEITEVRMEAMTIYFKAQNPELWEKSWKAAVAHYKQRKAEEAKGGGDDRAEALR